MSESPPQPDVAQLVAWASTEKSKLVDHFKDTGNELCNEIIGLILSGNLQLFICRVPYPDGKDFPHAASNGDVKILQVRATIAPKCVDDDKLTLKLGHTMVQTLKEVRQKFLGITFGAIETVDDGGPLLQVRNKEPIDVDWKSFNPNRDVVVNIVFKMNLDEIHLRGLYKAQGSPVL